MGGTPGTRWDQIEELFLNASELDLTKRGAFLDDACAGDAELRAKVEKRLDDYSTAVKFFKRLREDLGLSPIFSPGDLVAGRFRIVRLVGKGGMGEVYEAEDLNLDSKPIALKTLRATTAADEHAMAGVKSELDLARQVTHPNVCRVHDIYEHRTSAGTIISLFTMELLRGETLADRLRRLGRMTTTNALPLVKQMVAGLEAAHSVGVVHGDFKPANAVIVSSQSGAERVVVSDFGLARFVPAETALLPLTSEGVGWGTPEYMAPEQLQGRGTSCASDIYALGVVMYEMVTGDRPFTAGSPLALTLTKLRQAPRLPRDYVSNLDPRWESAILRCLDPDPERRFHAAGDVVAALEGRRPTHRSWILAVASVACIISLAIPSVRDAVWEKLWSVSPAVASFFRSQQTIALLPSVEPSGTKDGDALTVGLTASVTDHLSALWRDDHRFLVVPAAEVMGTGLKTAAQAEGILNVDLIVTLRLAQAEGRTSVTLTRYEGSRDALTVKQTQSIQTTVGNEALLETDVLHRITQMFGLTISPASWQRLTFGSTPSAERSNLAGRGYLVERLPASAIGKFEDAIRQDEKYVDAYVGLSDAYLRQYEDTKDKEFFTKASDAVDVAITLAPTDARAHVIKGRMFRALGLDRRAIDEEFQPVLRRDPDNADARNNLAQAYEAVENLQGAEEEYGKAIERHPHYWLGYENRGAFLFRHGFNRDAETNFEKGVKYAPSSIRASSNLGGIYLAQGNLMAADTELKRLKLPADAILYNNLGWLSIFDEKFGEALKYFNEAVKLPGADSVIFSSLARACRWSGKDPAARKAAYDSARARADEELKQNPNYPEIRANRAYLLAETGHASEALEEIRRTLDFKPKDTTVLFMSALVYEWVGHRSEALEALARAVSYGYPIAKIEHHPDLKDLQKDPGYRRVQMALESRTRR